MNRICLFLLLSIIVSCTKKKDANTPVKNTPVKFYIANNVGTPYNIRLYRTIHDYQYSVNAVVSLKLDSAEVYEGLSDPDSAYYADIYTDDFSFSNWGQHSFIGNPEFGDADITPYLGYSIVFKPQRNAYMMSDTTFTDVGARYTQNYTYPRVKDTTRMYFIGGNKPYTTWNAINMFDNNGNSVWDTLPPLRKQVALILNKSRLYNYSYYDGNNAVVTDTGFFSVTYSTNDRPEVDLLSLKSLYLSYRLLSYYRSTNQKTYGADTMVLTAPPGFVILVRNK